MRYLVFVLLICGCAKQSAPPKASHEIEPAKTFALVPIDQASSMDLMELGIKAFREQQYELAISVLNQAIKNNDLGFMYRIMAYWALAECHIFTNNPEMAAEAFFDFVVVSEYLIEYDTPYAEPFIATFKLKEKIAVAEEYMDKVWSDRN